MSDKQSEPTSAAAEKTPPPKPASSARKRSPATVFFVVVALLVALAALAGSAYNWWRTRDLLREAHQTQALRETLAREQTTIAQLKRQVAGLNTQLAETGKLKAELDTATQQIKNAVANVDGRVTALATDTSAAIARLQKQVGQPRAAARIADVDYLLRVARHQARIRHDPVAMHAALAGAGEALKGIHQPAADALRGQIGKALDELAKLPSDPAGAAATTLASLAAGVDKLPLRPPAGTAEATPAAKRPEPAHWWQRIGPGLADALDDLVTVRHVDTDVRPLLAPSERWFLYRNLALELDAARIAALKGDVSAYRAGIERAHQWLGRYFDASDPKVKAALQTLVQLHDAQLEPALPDLTDAFDTLDRLRRQIARPTP
ncbi:MAG TPA: uroporphyrinogen-III C-methyltransferase [Gammaproteobacteria bacterium]|nr:uroporphyrinogen-III C-methyltransferase [Gammaproteobacteria bacterium]